MTPEVIFEKASVLCYRIFDIADEIHLETAERILVDEAKRSRLAREGSQYLHLPNPPLSVGLGTKRLALRRGELVVEATGRIFDHGAASIILNVPVRPGMGFEELVALSDELYDSPAVEELSAELMGALVRRLRPALEDEHRWHTNENYTVLFAEKVSGDPTADVLFEQLDLARLLLGENGAVELSERERKDVTQNRFSYSNRDLVIVDWNSAFVYEPSGSWDIPNVLEICNAQLLEFRYYDDVLDRSIQSIYDEMQRHPRRWWYSVFWSPYKTLARRVLVTLIEMSEFIERVENSLKIIGDFYLAKVYEATVRRLRIPVWQASVTRKQELLAQTYQLLKGEVDIERSLLLEFTIVVLIVSEILLAMTQFIAH